MRLLILAVVVMGYTPALFGQNDLLDELPDDAGNYEVIQTFKGTRLVNGHTVETKSASELEFIISHRFGRLNSGGYNLYGLDDAFIRIGLEYGITDDLGVGIGRSSYDKTYDAYAKYKLLAQRPGVPVTVTLLGSWAYRTLKGIVDYEPEDRMAFAAQALIARKLSDRVAVQLAPVWVHKNLVDTQEEINDLLALGIGARASVTRSVALIGEYYLRLNPHENSPYNDALGIGVEIETGGHVFQLNFTNSIGMIERQFVSETSGDFFDGDVHFGFNITRTFQLGR